MVRKTFEINNKKYETNFGDDACDNAAVVIALLLTESKISGSDLTALLSTFSTKDDFAKAKAKTIEAVYSLTKDSNTSLEDLAIFNAALNKLQDKFSSLETFYELPQRLTIFKDDDLALLKFFAELSSLDIKDTKMGYAQLMLEKQVFKLRAEKQRSLDKASQDYQNGLNQIAAKFIPNNPTRYEYNNNHETHLAYMKERDAILNSYQRQQESIFKDHDLKINALYKPSKGFKPS